MFEKEIKFICDFCLNKISKAGSFLTFEKLKGIEIHPAILKYISAEIDFQVYKDRQILLQKSSFDYSGAEISKYFKMIAYEIKKTRRINENEINDLINKAVEFNFNFTIKPNETLTDFIFRDENTRNPDDIIMLLDYTYYYGYLSQILLSYLDKKQLLTISKNDFEFLLKKIDNELIAAKTNELVDKVLDSIADFFNIGGVLRSQIPPRAMELYLKEKNLSQFISRLEHVVEQNPKTKYEIEEIKKIIYSTASIAESKPEAAETQTIIPKEEEKKDIPSFSLSEDIKNEINSLPQDDLLKKPESKNEIEKIDLEEFEVTSDDDKKTIDLTGKINIDESPETFSIEPEELEEITPEDFTKEINQSSKQGGDILICLSDREIEKIIGYIFNEDREDFTTTIETISECKTYEKATEVLRTLYTTYKINPYSREAILLTNAVAKYFTAV
jgi:hypothetical protein